MPHQTEQQLHAIGKEQGVESVHNMERAFCAFVDSFRSGPLAKLAKEQMRTAAEHATRHIKQVQG